MFPQLRLNLLPSRSIPWRSSAVGMHHCADGSKFLSQSSRIMCSNGAFTPKQMPAQAFDGTYTLNGNVEVELKRNGGGELIAPIGSRQDDGFQSQNDGFPRTTTLALISSR